MTMGEARSDLRRSATPFLAVVTFAALVAAAVALGIGADVPHAAAQGTGIVAGELRTDATLDNIGVVWFVDGDADLDSTMTLEYRRVGDTSWRPGAPAMRAEPTVTVDGSPLGINSWAASALFLERDTSYELRVSLSDPDGGSATQTVTQTTRTMANPGSNIRFVEPGSGGGSGTPADPYRGLQAAADDAGPGDTFQIAAGTYAPFELRTSGQDGSPISFVGPGDGTAVIDGNGTDRGVVTIGKFDGPTEHVIISGVTIRDGRWGIDAQRTSHLTITDNLITDVDYGILHRRDTGEERFHVVCDNVIEGRTPWPGVGIPGERGIDLRGWGHTVCNNRVSNFADCVSLQPLTGTSFGNDVFGNDANRCVDDGIEVDYNQANVRVYRNRVTNSRMGVSVQPIYGGPAYIFRNELFNLESNTIKLNNGPSGLFIAHNTGVKLGNGLEDGSVFNNTVLRNNAIVGTRYAFEFTSTPTGFRDFDYGAWGTTRDVDPWFKWDNVRFDRLGDLPAGVESNGIEISFDDLQSAGLPASWDVEVSVGSPDLRPVAGSPAIDASAQIDNLNDPFVLDGAPDAGAFEFGEPQPGYGPGTPLIERPDDPSPAIDPTIAVSCLAGNGRVDVNLVSRGPNTTIRMEFEGLTAREAPVLSGDWWRQSVTGRPDGDYTIVLTTASGARYEETVSVACDLAVPQVSGDEIQVINACRADRGYLLFQFANPRSAAQPYVIEFAGVPNRSTTAAPFGATVRAVTGRPDGTYSVLIRDGSTVLEAFPVTVSCP